MQEKGEWKAAKLAQKLDISLPLLRKRMAIWLAAGAVTLSQPATGRGAPGDVTYRRYALTGLDTLCSIQSRQTLTCRHL